MTFGLRNAAQTFQRFIDEQYSVVLNPRKCVFGEIEVKFLGYIVSKEGSSPCTEKVKTMRDFPEPVTAKQLRRFLGMINFYRRFIPRAAQAQAPLNDLL
ncbi:Transposon Tf2-8 polyprotein [Anthophora plagiata]